MLEEGHAGPHGIDDGTTWTWPQMCKHVFDDGKCLLCGLDLEYTHGEIKP
jgi:hypothetical protein